MRADKLAIAQHPRVASASSSVASQLSGGLSGSKMNQGAAGQVSSRRRLVVVRAGATSLHNNWLAGPDVPTFDLAISSFVQPTVAESPDCFSSYAPGGKWEGLAAFFLANPFALENYDWIWLPDDDLDATTSDLNKMFDIAQAYNLDLAQPSLTWDSYFSWLITLQNPNFKLRYTNFVELMAPLFSAPMLKGVLPAFSGRRFGWGLDLFWSRWMPDPAFRTAIIDATSVRHTKPIGKGPLYQGDEDLAVTEMNNFMAAYDEQLHEKVVYAGIDHNGRMLKRGPRLRLTHYWGWRPLVKQLLRTPRDLVRGKKKLSKSMKAICCVAAPDLTPLPVPTEAAGK